MQPAIKESRLSVTRTRNTSYPPHRRTAAWRIKMEQNETEAKRKPPSSIIRLVKFIVVIHPPSPAVPPPYKVPVFTVPQAPAQAQA
jgi:hypothetical protein